MTVSRCTLGITALTLATLGACGGREQAGRHQDSTAASPAADSAATTTGKMRVEGFQHPESAKYDAELDVWYVSNVNGSPFEKDGNGYISRLKGDGTVDSLKFIAAGVNGVKLDGPKGIGLQGDTLWVADITNVRAFNRRTGAPVASVALKGAKFLNDVAIGEDGVYITDTGIESTTGGQIKHTGPDRIYRIDAKHAATVALEDDSLAGPNGITWDAANHRFIVGPNAGKTIVAWTPGTKTLTPLAATKGQIDGVEILGGSKLLVTSWADSSLDVVDNGKVTPVSTGLPSPADIGVDTKRHRVAIPLLLEDRVEFRDLPAAKEGM